MRVKGKWSRRKQWAKEPPGYSSAPKLISITLSHKTGFFKKKGGRGEVLKANGSFVVAVMRATNKAQIKSR